MTTTDATTLANALAKQLDRAEVPRIATGDDGPTGKPAEGIPRTHVVTLVRFFERDADRAGFDALLENLADLDAAETRTHGAPLAYYATLQRIVRDFLGEHELDADALHHVLAWTARLVRRQQPVVDRPPRPTRGPRGRGGDRGGDRGPRGRRERGGRDRGDEGSLRDVRPVRETTIGDLLGNALTAPATPAKPEPKSGRHKGVLTITGERRGKAWLATTADGESVACTGVPAFPKPDAGDTFRAILIYVDGAPESAVFKGWT